VCRVIDAFVDRLDMAGWDLERAEAAETVGGLAMIRSIAELYLYGYLQQNSVPLAAAGVEAGRNIALMWLLGR